MSRTYFTVAEEDRISTPLSAPTGEASSKLKDKIISALVSDFARREWKEIESGAKYLAVSLTEELVAFLSKKGCQYIRERDAQTRRLRPISTAETDRNGFIGVEDAIPVFTETRLWCVEAAPESAPEKKSGKQKRARSPAPAAKRDEWQFRPVDAEFESVGTRFDFDWSDELLKLLVTKPEGRQTRVWQLIGDKRLRVHEVAEDGLDIDAWVKASPDPLFQHGNSPYEPIADRFL